MTLKIVINEQIVSELQLTVQANAASYNFAHKVYELERTKVFSKLKISHNYFEEFQGDFKELVLRGVDLSIETHKSLAEKENKIVLEGKSSTQEPAIKKDIQ